MQPIDIGPAKNPALADENDASGNVRRKALCHREVDCKRAQVTVIDPNDFRAQCICSTQFGRIVHFDQRFEAALGTDSR